ncbi:MAG: T9SS type A sorting domain-containing protein, partial [Bacteroidetes bacterium]|nr:T9SS type A sorting domain-containing protein [Bacteroidota bacterium]
ATTAIIELSDNTGRIIYRRNTQINAGENFTRLTDLYHYSSGIYYVHVKTTEFSAVEKLFIKHN